VAIGVCVEGEDPIEVPYIVGADIFISKTCFLRMGGFDEKYFMYYEETDLFFRLYRSGLKSYVLPEAQIVHLEGGSLDKLSESFSRKKFEWMLNSKLLYYRKWVSRYLRPLLYAIIFIQIIVQYIKGKMGKELLPLLRHYLMVINSVSSKQSVVLARQ
jgi:GT2 family glycosyltransferase